jgi:hypothetical protein
MLLHGLDEDLGPRQPDAPQPVDELHGRLGADPSRAAVGDEALRVDGAEVTPRGDIARAQVELDAEGLEHAAADLVLERVVAEEAEVPRPAARGDARRDVSEEPTRRLPGQRGQVGNPGRLELRLPCLRPGQSPEPIQRQQNDLRLIRHHERLNQLEHAQVYPNRPSSRAPTPRPARAGRTPVT